MKTLYCSSCGDACNVFVIIAAMKLLCVACYDEAVKVLDEAAAKIEECK